MYFIVAYYGCVGLIAALGEAGSISMRGGDGHNLQLETTNIDMNSDLVERSKIYNWTIEYFEMDVSKKLHN